MQQGELATGGRIFEVASVSTRVSGELDMNSGKAFATKVDGQTSQDGPTSSRMCRETLPKTLFANQNWPPERREAVGERVGSRFYLLTLEVTSSGGLAHW